MIEGAQVGPSNIFFPQTSHKKDDSFAESFELSTQTGVPLNTESASGTGFALSQNPPKSDQTPTTTRELALENDPLLVDEDIEFPEGGLKAYLVVFGSFMGLIPAFGMVNSAGAIEAYVSSHQLASVSASSVSWIFSINTFVGFSSGIFAGAFFDRNGARALMIMGTIFFCGGLFATGNCQTVYQFVLAFGVVNGLGLGMLMSPLVGVVSHYFYKKRATACSIATIGGSVGGIAFPLLLRKLYPTVGFAWAMRILSFTCLVCLLFSLVFAKERVGINKAVKEQVTFKSIFKAYFLDVFDPRSLKEVKFLFCALAVSFSESSLVVSAIYFPSYAIRRGFGENTSYLLITVLNATGILGRYLPGYLADRFIGRFNIMILTLSGCVLVSFLLWLPFGHSLKVLYAFAVLYGFCSGSILSLAPSCCGQISRTDQFGKRYSTMYMIAALGMLAFIPLGGAVISNGSIHNYNNFIIYSTMLIVGAILCYGISRYSVVGFRLCKF